MPSFFLALIFIYVFAFQLKWLPFGGIDSPKHLIMPVFAVAIPMSVGYALFLRTNMLNAAGAEYSRTARSKGLGRWRVNFKHVLPNALIPVVTLASLDMAFLLTGIVLIERVFSIPGIGLQVLTATQQRDIPVVMGSVFFGALLIAAGNLIADILVARLDPRIRLGE
jgi:peptide/nickel transport system permease protein